MITAMKSNIYVAPAVFLLMNALAPSAAFAQELDSVPSRPEDFHLKHRFIFNLDVELT
jgi:hypothetical protein